jgi:hypothetical protein
MLWRAMRHDDVDDHQIELVVFERPAGFASLAIIIRNCWTVPQPLA